MMRQYHIKRLKRVFPIVVLIFILAITAFQVPVVREFFIGASGVEANIFVDLSGTLGHMPQPWKNLAQGGEDHAWTVAQVQNEVQHLQPEYIRIDHLYDFYDPVTIVNGQPVYSWEKADAAVQAILATGAKPYLSLSYTPTPLIQTDIVGEPSDYSMYQRIIRDTILHYSKTLAIEDVIYEMWNEPDLFGGWKVYGPKNYLKLYEYAGRGALEARTENALPFTFGGPAITALYKNWVDALVKKSIEQNLPLDFISWHRYTTDVDQYEKDARDVREWLDAYPQLLNVELHITEWGHDSNNQAGYDTQYGAAHTVLGGLAMIGKVDRGFVFEIQDGKDPAGNAKWGRWGLLTHSSGGAEKKPRYNAILELNQLEGEWLPVAGNGSWVKAGASQVGAEYRILLANFDEAGTHRETVPLTLTNIPAQTLRVRKKSISGIVQESEVATTEADIRLEIPMEPLSVVMVTITEIVE